MESKTKFVENLCRCKDIHMPGMLSRLTLCWIGEYNWETSNASLIYFADHLRLVLWIYLFSVMQRYSIFIWIVCFFIEILLLISFFSIYNLLLTGPTPVCTLAQNIDCKKLVEGNGLYIFTECVIVIFCSSSVFFLTKERYLNLPLCFR